MYNLYGSYFCGNKISDYGIESGYLDYKTLAESFDAVLYNDYYKLPGEWLPWCGSEYDEETGTYKDFFQFYIVSEAGAEILDGAGECVYYNSELDMYVWGVDHCGTSWDYVLTRVKCNTGAAALETV